MKSGCRPELARRKGPRALARGAPFNRVGSFFLKKSVCMRLEKQGESNVNIVFFNLNRFDYERGCEKQLYSMAKSLLKMGNSIYFVGESYFYLNLRPRLENMVYRLFGARNRHDLNKKPASVFAEKAISLESLDLGFHLFFSKKRTKIMKILRQARLIYVKNEFIDTAYLYFLLGPKMFSEKVIIGVHTAIFGYDDDSLHSRVHNFLYFSFLYRNFLKTSRLIHVPVASYSKLLNQAFCLEPRKIIHLPYIIEAPEAAEFCAGKGPFRLLFAGRLTAQKGVDYLELIIRSFSVKPFFKRMEFVIAGCGELDYMAVKLSASFDNVKFVGFVKEMEPYYRDTDIVIIPSRWETVSYIALESQLRGIPVIAFDIPGPADIVFDSVTGFIVNKGDVEAFCRRIEYLFDLKEKSPQEFSAMKNNARQKSLAKFSLDTSAGLKSLFYR
jgi:glycosyltransferase involved in cell wall biosynthesis